jgi:hypothetical protein
MLEKSVRARRSGVADSKAVHSALGPIPRGHGLAARVRADGKNYKSALISDAAAVIRE